MIEFYQYVSLWQTLDNFEPPLEFYTESEWNALSDFQQLNALLLLVCELQIARRRSEDDFGWECSHEN